MRFLGPVLSCLVLLAPLPSRACDLALLLAVDVSGSVDRDEYAIQMRGIANGFRDPVVSDALVRSKARVALVQWSGTSRQDLSVPWVAITSFKDVDALALQVENTARKWRNYSTAIGEALQFSVAQMRDVGDCTRKVIDVSGDGHSNEGIEPDQVRGLVQAAGVSVNALAIEGAEEDLTGYLWVNVIGGEGAFVVTADGFDDFADKMRLKLRREIRLETSQLGAKLR